MPRLTVSEISRALKNSEKTLPTAYRALHAVGDKINVLLARIAKLDEEIDEATTDLASVAAKKQLSELDNATARIRNLIEARDQAKRDYQGIWSNTIDTSLEPLVSATNAAMALETVLRFIRERWDDFPSDLQKDMSNTIGAKVDFNRP